MATVTKPMALDESFNTTENTSRNVADVLAEGLDAIADAVTATQQSLENLSDVNITNPQANDGLKYDSTSGEWVNGSVASSIHQLTDVDDQDKANGTSLVYNGTDSEWQAKKLTVSMTQAQWDAISDKAAWRTAHKGVSLVITDAPNLNATASDIEYSSGVTVKQAIDGKTVYRKYYSGTTTASGNINPTSFDYTKYVIISATARDSNNTSTHYLVNIWGGSNLLDGTNTFHLMKITDHSTVSNTAVEGYYWYVEFTSGT